MNRNDLRPRKNRAGCPTLIEAIAIAKTDIKISKASRVERPFMIPTRVLSPLRRAGSFFGCEKLLGWNRRMRARSADPQAADDACGRGAQQGRRLSPSSSNSPMAAMPFSAPWAITAGQTLCVLADQPTEDHAQREGEPDHGLSGPRKGAPK